MIEGKKIIIKTQKSIRLQRDQSLDKNLRHVLHQKLNKILTKSHNHVIQEKTRRVNRQIEETEKSKDDLKCMFTAQEDISSIKPKTLAVTEHENQYFFLQTRRNK